jgi:hypothetical protein
MLPLLALLAACAALRVGSDFERSANFSAYHTFSWLMREHHGSSYPLVEQRAREAIQAELARKGDALAEGAAKPEFLVDFTIGARDRMEVATYPAPFDNPWYRVGPGWWGYPYWGSQVDVYRYREGTLGIDLFDANTHRPVWHGWAKKPLSKTDAEHSEEPIRAAVQAVLAQFPPK